jgi:hypothetical protein
VTLKKKYPKPKEEITTKVRFRKEEQKQQEADKEIQDYLSNRQPTKPGSTEAR